MEADVGEGAIDDGDRGEHGRVGQAGQLVGPATGSERLVAIDAVRGLAIFGVLVANTIAFAYPMWDSNSAMTAVRDASLFDRAATLLLGLFVQGKFYALLSVLFGAGLVMQGRRLDAGTQPANLVLMRRSLALLAIGLFHGVLLYSADILAFYAIVSMAALLFRRVPARALLASSAAALIAGVIVLSAYGAAHPASPVPGPPDWAARLAAVDTAGEQDPDFIEAFAVRALRPLAVRRADLYRFLADEQGIFALGTWRSMTCHRMITYLLFGMPAKVCLLGLPVLGYFLLGMYFAKRGFPTASARERSFGRLFVMGGAVGVTLQILGALTAPAAVREPGLLPVFWLCSLAGALILGVAYAAGASWWCEGRERTLIVAGLAAVGRTALSNYLAQSVLLGLIFYNTGLGWFGTVGAGPVVVLALPIMAIQVMISMRWLQVFEFGPAEWVVRCAAYGRLVPMRRPTGAVRTPAAPGRAAADRHPRPSRA